MLTVTALEAITATVEPGTTGFAVLARTLVLAAKAAGYEVDSHKDRVYAVYGEDVRAYVDLFFANNKARVCTYLDCPNEDSETMQDSTTTELILNAIITRIDAHKLPSYLEALKDRAESLDPDWRHRGVSFHDLTAKAKMVFK